MSFLNPFFLAALAAVAIPVVVHMLSRRRVPLFYFSSLRFLRTSDRRSMRRVNLRRILLMLLRMGGVALLALAFARPVVRGGLASLFPGGGSRAGCILLDRSYSMGVESGEGNLFDEAKRKVEEILDRFTPEDEIALLLFDSGLERIYRGGGEGRAIGIFLDEARLSYRTTDLRRAAHEGLEALRESRREARELYIVSDFQRSSLAGMKGMEGSRPIGENGDPEKGPDPLAVMTYLVRIGEDPPRNAAVERVTVPGVILHKGEIATIGLTLSGDGAEARFPVELHLDGRRIMERELEVGGSGRTTAEFSFPVERSGWSRGEVRKRSDRLRADDRRFFALEVVDRVPVLLVADERYLYIEQALSPEGADTDIALEIRSYAELASDDLDRADVVVLGPGSGLSVPDIEIMERFVMDGGKLLVFLPPGLDGTALALSAYPLSIDRMERGDGFVTIVMPAAIPYFLRPLGAETMDAMTELRFRRVAMVSGVGKGGIQLFYSNGHPFVWEEIRGAGAMIFCAIDPVPEVGDLVLSPYFLPLVQQAVLVTGRSGARDGALIGETIQWSGGAEGDVRYEMPALSGDGAPAAGLPTTRVGTDGSPGVFVVPGAETPGFITLTDGADTTALFAVNPDCRLESDLTPATGGEVADSLDLEHYIVVEEGESLAGAVRRGREGREITLLVALAAILLFAVESVVAQRRYEGGEGVG